MMNDDAKAVITELLGALTSVVGMGGVGKRPGHMVGCNQGVWAGKYIPPAYPHGSPCSARCQAARNAIRKAEAWLEINAAVAEQGVML